MFQPCTNPNLGAARRRGLTRGSERSTEHAENGPVRRRRAGHRSAPRCRRGLTFLEVVCAVGILALVVASVTAVVTFIVNSQQVQQRKLNATEVANRLMLIYLDDPNELKRLGPFVPYDKLKYRWQLREGDVGVRSVKAGGVQGSVNSLDRFTNVTLVAWLSEESGGSSEPQPGVPIGKVSRLVDPVPLRNPDSLKNAVKDDSLRAGLIGNFVNPGSRGNRGAPRPKPGNPVNPSKPAPGGGK